MALTAAQEKRRQELEAKKTGKTTELIPSDLPLEEPVTQDTRPEVRGIGQEIKEVGQRFVRGVEGVLQPIGRLFGAEIPEEKRRGLRDIPGIFAPGELPARAITAAIGQDPDETFTEAFSRTRDPAERARRLGSEAASFGLEALTDPLNLLSFGGAGAAKRVVKETAETGAGIAARRAANLLATKRGIPLSAAEQLAKPGAKEATGVVAGLESALEKTAFGRGPAATFREGQRGAVQTALEETQATIGKEIGGQVQRGQAIQDIVREGTEREARKLGTITEDIGELAGQAGFDIEAVKDPIRDAFNELGLLGKKNKFVPTRDGLQLSEEAFNFVKKKAVSIRQLESFDELKRLRTQIRDKGEIFADKGRFLASDKPGLQKIDDAITTAMQEQISRSGGEDAVKLFNETNASWTEYYRAIQNTKIKQIVKEENVQNIFTKLVNKRSVNEIKLIKNLVTPEEFTVMQRALIDDLVDKVQIATAKPGAGTAGAALQKEFDKFGPDLIDEIFNADQIEEIGKTLAGIDRTGTALTAFINSSNTARGNEQIQALQSLIRAGIDPGKQSLIEAATSLLTRPISSAVFSERGRRVIPAAVDITSRAKPFLKELGKRSIFPTLRRVVGTGEEEEKR